ncbi:MAG: hypothetical protein KBH94_02185 [Caldisericia bacterium]|nr:hypothetical protein [Caldisericia bacterium]HOW03182.1 stalk domain-containing protein [Caldisericia bacterium]
MKLKRFISLLVLSMFFSSFFTFTSFVFSEETNPLNIEKIIGVPENKGVFRMATQDGSQFFPMYQQGLVLDSKGNIYIGDSGESQIEVFDSGFKSIRNFGEIGTGNGKFQYLTAMCIDENDNIYTVDSYNAYIQIFSSDGKVIKKFGEKGEDDNKLLNPSGIAILKSGDLVITDYASGVKVFSKSGEFKQLFTDDSRIYNPTGVTVDNDGYVYITITDYQSGSSILKYSPEGEFIVTAVSAGASENKLAGFATSVCIDGNYLYVTSMGSNNVFAQKFEIEKDPKAPLKFIEIISSYPKSNVIGETDIALPTSIFAKDGLVYILDGLINRLIILDEAKNLKGSIQSPVLLYGYLYGNQKKPKGYMSNPQGVRVDSEGRIFVGDSNYHDVVVFDSEGEEINRFGKFITQRGIVPGELYNPTDIIVDPDGYVYVSDVATSVVQVFDPDFEPVMAIEEGFNNPQGLAFDSEGNLLVISSRSSIVSRIDISDVIDEEASEIDSYPLEGEWPVGISVDKDDNMYIAMTGSDEVHILDYEGELINRIGSRGVEPGNFAVPQGVCVDGEGNFYVAETENGRIQKFDQEGELIWCSELNWPGLTLIVQDSDGKLYVTDCLHSTVLVISDETASPPTPPGPVQTEASFKLEIATEELIEGDNIIVRLIGDKLENIGSILAGIKYPENLIEFKNGEPGELLTGKIKFNCSKPQAVEGLVTISCETENKAGLSGNGVIYELEFTNKTSGDGALEIDKLILKDPKGRELLPGKIEKSISFTIKPKDVTPPILEIEEIPAVSYEEKLTIKGKTEPGAVLTINEKEVPVNEDGSFSVEIVLTMGENKIEIIAKDAAGNESKIEKIVTLKERVIIKLQVGSKVILINNKAGSLDAPPFIDKNSGRTLVPIRPVVEAIDGNIDWNNDERKVTITKDNIKIELWIGKITALVNGKEVKIDPDKPVAPVIVSGRTFLPLRFVTENLGFKVDWDAATQTITLTYPNPDK